MKRLKRAGGKSSILLLLVTLLCLLFCDVSFGQNDPGIPDTVWFDISQPELPGPPATAQLQIPVIFFHDTPITIFVVTLTWTGPLFLDSVVFSPTIKDYLHSEAVEINNMDKNVLIFGGGEEPYIPPGTYPVSYLYFTPQDSGAVVIDTCFIGTNWLRFLDPADYWTPVFIKAEFTIYCSTNISGDANQSGEVDVVDVVFLIDYLFRDGPPPDPLCTCDVNTDCIVSISDIVYLINYLFKNGPAPLPNCYHTG